MSDCVATNIRMANTHSNKYTTYHNKCTYTVCLILFTSKEYTMLPAPNHNARLRPGDRLWVDLTLSGEESDHGDDGADNNRQLIAARANNNDRLQRNALPPRVDINPYAPPDWNPNPVPPRANPRRADPPPTPPPYRHKM